MAVKINGALIVEQVYEWGIEDLDGKVYLQPDYESGKRLADALNASDRFRMRVRYVTEWMDAQ